MIDHDYFIVLFKKINTNFKNIELQHFEFYLKQYIFFMLNIKYSQKINSIYIFIKNFSMISKMRIFNNFDINSDEKAALLSLLLFRSISRVSLTTTVHQINFLSSDSVLNECVEIYKNFNLFYHDMELNHDEVHYFKGFMVKVVKLLIMEKIVLCKKSFSKNNTLEQWSFGYDNIALPEFTHLKISNKPYKLLKVNDNYFIVGEFFTMIKKTFIENIKSNHFFKLKDMTYVENIIQNKIFLNINDLQHVIDTLTIKKGMSLVSIENSVYIKNNEIQINSNTIHNNKVLLNNNIINCAKKIVFDTFGLDINNIDFVTLKNKSFDIFYHYSIVFFASKKNYDFLNDNNKYKYFETIYTLFKKNFNEAYFNLVFNNIEEYNKYINSFKMYDSEEINTIPEYPIFLGYVSKNVEKSKIEIKKKINAENISFFSYLVIYNKKEIDNILIKNAAKIKKICENGETLNTIDYVHIEKYEDYYKNYFFLATTVFIKFDFKDIKESLNTSRCWQEINNLNKMNKKLFAEISQLLHIYNVFLLNDYIKKNDFFVIDKYGNTLIYFIFYFDFRGRFYYDSVISPTSNRYCRLIYNYGVCDIHKTNFSLSEISIIISNYSYYITKIKKTFNIEHDLPIVNEAIFWILISIGKLSINKSSIKLSINDFLDKSVTIIENCTLSDDLDILEYDYYLKILYSLKNNIVIRRCLIKDATASFFQNLVRILGSKDNESKKIANLDSTTHWYDWYSHLIKKWKDEETKNDTVNFEILKFFTRKTIKKIIMTNPYSASFVTSFDYFQDGVLKEFDILIDITDDIGIYFIKFYKFLNKQMEHNGPFKKNSSEIVIHFKKILKENEKIVIISRNDDLVDLTYYKTITKHFDFIVFWGGSRKRLIKNYAVIDKNTLDEKKISTSLKANLVHFADALLVRDINKEIYSKMNIYYISIHDSFMVDFLHTSQFIISANNQINKDVFKNEIWPNEDEFFSIFVFL